MARQTDARDDIRQAAVALHARRGIEDVGVSELCRLAGVARTTFYAHYDNVAEPLEEVEDDLVGRLSALNRGFASASTTQESLTAYFGEGLTFVDENRATFHALLVDHPRYRFIDLWRGAIRENFAGRVHAARPALDEGFALDALAACAIEFYRTYVEDPGHVSSQDAATVVAIILRALGGEPESGA